MTNDTLAFEPDIPREAAQKFELHLDFYDGPLDLLLNLARDNKVDLRVFPINTIVDQYLIHIDQNPKLVDENAQYLVMAAYLIQIRSRLLIEDNTPAQEAANAELRRLRDTLIQLDAIKKIAAEIAKQPILGSDTLIRGHNPEPVKLHYRYDETVTDLVLTWLAIQKDIDPTKIDIEPSRLASMDDALIRIDHLLSIGAYTQWTPIDAAAPKASDELEQRAHIASTFAASLELARQNKIDIIQDGKTISIRKSNHA